MDLGFVRGGKVDFMCGNPLRFQPSKQKESRVREQSLQPDNVATFLAIILSNPHHCEIKL